MKTEAVQPVLPGKLDLPPLDVPHAQVVEPELAGQLGLVMPNKLRDGARDVRPFREPPAPPLVVFVDGMELREVKRDEPYVRIRDVRMRDGDVATAPARRVGQVLEVVGPRAGSDLAPLQALPDRLFRLA